MSVQFQPLTVECVHCRKPAAVLRVPVGDVKELLRPAVPLEYRAVLSLVPNGIDARGVVEALAVDRVECLSCHTLQGGAGGKG